MPKVARILMAGALVAGLSGCASYLNGPYEKISVVTNPAPALCKIYREGHGYVKSVATPGETYIMRDPAPITITCSKRGYQTKSVTVAAESDRDDSIAGNIVSLGAGLPVDVANSAHINMPDTIRVNLTRL